MDKAEYIKDMRNQIATYRRIINKRSDELLDSAQSEKRKLRLKYMDLKDLLNELDKSVDKFSDVDDKSWEQVKVDIEEMWEGIRSEINKFNRREK